MQQGRRSVSGGVPATNGSGLLALVMAATVDVERNRVAEATAEAALSERDGLAHGGANCCLAD